jgi:cobalt-zinc-cadmium efflux system protein
MNSPHSHYHKDVSTSKKPLGLALSATLIIFLVEAAGALWSNSLSLLADSAHVLMDALSFGLTYLAIVLAEKPTSNSRTFGLHRLEVFAALLNGLTVFITAGVITVSAFRRLHQPQQILTLPMLSIAVLGLAVNLFVIWKLHPILGEDVNVKSAFLHALGDALASVAVVVGGIIIYFTGAWAVDSLMAILVAGVIFFGVYGLFRDSIQILLEGAPKGLEKDKLIAAVEEISGLGSAQDLHIWSICSHIRSLSLHISLPETRIKDQTKILREINLSLEKKFNIVHTTIQIDLEGLK